MQDSFGRQVSYLRLSVTDRCNFRCNYCMNEQMTFLPRAELLSIEELARLSSRFIEMGIRRLRITGGEPLVRHGLRNLLQSLSGHLQNGTLQELTMTSNGVLLPDYADYLYQVGMRRINISLDTLDAGRFRELTRKGSLDAVMKGIDAADRAGLRIKINVVALKDINDAEWLDIVSWCGERGFDVTFIESMPMGDIGQLRARHFVPVDQVQRALEEHYTLLPSVYRTGGPARYFDITETAGRVGFITPYTHNFCESCNRVRVSCTGQLYLCLGQDHMVDLREVMRNDASPEALTQAIMHGMQIKPRGHDFDAERLEDGAQVIRFMSHTGG